LLASVENGGALCVRFARGTSNLSSHSFGTAVDLAFDKSFFLPPESSIEMTKQRKAAKYFERAGWVWGGKRDYGHFEVGVALIEK
jgi:hypothetical protein